MGYTSIKCYGVITTVVLTTTNYGAVSLLAVFRSASGGVASHGWPRSSVVAAVSTRLCSLIVNSLLDSGVLLFHVCSPYTFLRLSVCWATPSPIIIKLCNVFNCVMCLT